MAQTPKGFPTPEKIEGYWDWDKIHAPRPVTPLAGDAVVMTMSLKRSIVNNDLYPMFAPQEGADNGQAFLDELHYFFEALRRRSDGIYEVSETRWREDPAMPLNTVQGYLLLGDENESQHQGKGHRYGD
jgi:hypothetical protein